MEQFNVDWEKLLSKDRKQALLPQKKLRDDQKDALKNVVRGFAGDDVGKMIMPCGTGKTFTALKVAEKMGTPNGTVLLLVPSLSLVSQTLQEWSQQAQRPLQIFVVCSDTKVGKKDDEDIHTYDLALPSTTDPCALADEMRKALTSNNNSRTMNVIFSTYQSIEVVAEAQEKRNIPVFDLIICDEAHRTTGVEDRESKSSYFTQVHDKNFIKASKRLFMTATPRIYTEKSKKKAKEYDVEVFSMDEMLECVGKKISR